MGRGALSVPQSSGLSAHPWYALVIKERWRQALNSGDLQSKYDAGRDIFTLTVGGPRPAGSIERGDGVVLRVDLGTDELIGAEVDNFRRVFLKQHPELGVAWDEAHGTARRLFQPRRVDESWRALTSIVAHLLERDYMQLAGEH